LKRSLALHNTFVAVLCAALLACGNPSSTPAFKNTDVTGADFAKNLSLTDHKGERRTLADFKGKVVVVFFGFTHCPDVCPTTLGELATALKALGPQAENVQVLFITVDPERDTREVLAQYVPAFDASFLGLRGTLEETAAVAKEFKIIYQKQGGGENYTVDHSAGTYIFDRDGRLRLYAPFGQKADALVHDIRLLLQS
jgi:protein SCO1/2